MRIGAEAAQAYRRCFELDPADYAAWGNCGQALRETRDWKAAEDFYTYAIGANPDFAPEAYFQRGKLRGRRSDIPGAIDDIKASIALGRNDAEAHYFLAGALLMTGDTSAAIEQYKKTLGLDPAYRDAQARLSALESANPATQTSSTALPNPPHAPQ
jgi:tetratricopeptide (TPR) repeat protein